MKKITITTFLFVGTALWSGMFDNSTDVKSQYEFDMKTANKNKELASALKKFQNNEVSEEDINRYILSRDDNKSTPFEDDVSLDESLQNSFPKKDVEKGWFSSLYDSMFGETAEESPVIEQEMTQEDNPQQGAE